MTKRKFRITKSFGGKENFSRRKLYNSLRRSGLSKKQCQSITDKVSHEVGEGSRTKDIYSKTLHLVKKDSPLAAVHYSLKRAILKLGPTGHHFETYVAKYFEHKGFKTCTRKIMRGKFVQHEIDVIAQKKTETYFVECKFHNRVGIKNDIKVALYVKARWDDLKLGNQGKNLSGFYIASNTAFSSVAITYAQGTGLGLLGVNAPPENSFLDEVKEMQLYPITSLKSLTKLVRNQLLDKGIVLAKELPRNINLLFKLGMKEEEIDRLLLEAEKLEDKHL